MFRCLCPLLLAILLRGNLAAQGEDVVFRSDVSLVRVDVQVLDRSSRAIAGLQIKDFVLFEGGKQREIRNFASEDMPVDLLFLLDVSGSMRPNVQLVANAAHGALRVLREQDRVALMVFDRVTRVRLPFKSSMDDVNREFDRVVNQERFNGGTDITQALFEAANYVGRNARKEARRAIVIVTDDQTEFEAEEARVSRALAKEDIVLSALIAPDMMMNRSGIPGGGYPGGGGYPRRRSGGLGGVIIGGGIPFPGGGGYPRTGGGYPGGRGGGYPGGGGGYPGGGNVPVITNSRTRSAGTAEIARQSGGDSLPVDDGTALETTLSRIRQRYALHFLLPEGSKPGEDRDVDVQLAANARRMYPDAEIRFRRKYMSPNGSMGSGPTVISKAPPAGSEGGVPAETASSSEPDSSERKVIRRRPISEPGGARGPNLSVGVPSADDQKPKAEASAPAPSAPSPAPPATGGWRKLKPGEQP